MKRNIAEDRLRDAAPVLLRLSLAALFLWFGINQLLDPESFVSYVPGWAPLDVFMVVMLNGIFETVFGTLLALGIFTRAVALVLGVHIFGIGASLGYNDLAWRDIALSLATFSIMLHGADRWSLDGWMRPGKMW